MDGVTATCTRCGALRPDRSSCEDDDPAGTSPQPFARWPDAEMEIPDANRTVLVAYRVPEGVVTLEDVTDEYR